MKTKNNVQKIILRSLAIVVSFFLISFTVSAQDFWKKLLENSSFNQIACAMIETSDDDSSEIPASTNNSFYYEKAFDSKLELENWMTSENYFMSTFFFNLKISTHKIVF